MSPQQGVLGQTAHRTQRKEPTRESSAHSKAAKIATVSHWLNEKPRQEHWNAVARMHESGSGKGQVKSKF
jgi:hypothetical protein